MVIGMVADAVGDVVGKKVIRVPGMFRGRLLILAVLLLAHQAVVLNVVYRFKNDVCADNLRHIKQQAPRAGNDEEQGQQRQLAHDILGHFVAEDLREGRLLCRGISPRLQMPGPGGAAGDGAIEIGVNAFVEPGRVFVFVRSHVQVVAPHMNEFIMRIKQKNRRDLLDELINFGLRVQHFVGRAKTNPAQQTATGDEQAVFDQVEVADVYGEKNNRRYISDGIEPGDSIAAGKFQKAKSPSFQNWFRLSNR